jgi:GT2 family glycosyltransferase
MKVAVLITSHNRCASTLACLQAIFSAELPPDLTLDVVLYDDGSSDGTPDAVRRVFPAVHLLIGDGASFWSGGMRGAFRYAKAAGYDGYLWLNDDVVLMKGALARLLLAAFDGREHPEVLIGTCIDPHTHRVSYGGLTRVHAWHPTKFRRIEPDPVHKVACLTMNGNIVYIPQQIAAIVGNIDAAYIHSMGDTDYGFRVRRHGFPLSVLPGVYGYCSRNATSGTYEDSRVPLRERWRLVRQPKGYPVRPWLTYVRRHGGWLWPLFWLWPYVRSIVPTPVDGEKATRKGGM